MSFLPDFSWLASSFPFQCWIIFHCLNVPLMHLLEWIIFWVNYWTFPHHRTLFYSSVAAEFPLLDALSNSVWVLEVHCFLYFLHPLCFLGLGCAPGLRLTVVCRGSSPPSSIELFHFSWVQKKPTFANLPCRQWCQVTKFNLQYRGHVAELFLKAVCKKDLLCCTHIQMFIAALFMIIKIWKQQRCFSDRRRMALHVCGLPPQNS